MLTRDEFQAFYDQGPDATYALLQQVQEQMQATIDALSVQVGQLSERIRQLEARLSKDSHNSSKPPSSDGLSKPTPKPRSLRRQTGRHPGAQPGHLGRTLQMAEHPDVLAVHRPPVCAACGGSLEGVEMHPVQPLQRRQVFDLPPQRLQVTEHQVPVCICPQCQAPNQADFPAGVTQPAQYGPGVLGLGVYLTHYQLLPLARTEQLLDDLFGCAPSQGTLVHAASQCYGALQPVEAAIKGAIAQATVAHFDETGGRIAKRLHWLHVASTRLLTFYARHAKRGRQAFADINILPRFMGTAVHDALHSYDEPSYCCQHALCNAHLLRELQAIWEDYQQTWAQRLSALLRALYVETLRAQEAGQDALPAERLQRYRVAYRHIVERALQRNPRPPATGKRGRPVRGPVRNLLERLDARQEDVLRFAADFGVPFDNNTAERDLRMLKLHEKVSGCFRTEGGADQFCRIRGYISTLRKQGVDLLEGLRSAVEGAPLQPSLQPT